jgi:hypothetical protein
VRYDLYVFRLQRVKDSGVRIGGRDSSVGIALMRDCTVQGSNPGGGRDFPHLSRPNLGPTQSPVQWVPGLSLGVKRPGSGAEPHLQCRGLTLGRAIPLPALKTLVARKGGTFNPLGYVPVQNRYRLHR